MCAELGNATLNVRTGLKRGNVTMHFMIITRPTIRPGLAGTVPVQTSVLLSRSDQQNVPEFHFSEIFKMNSSLMIHCSEIIPLNGHL